MTDRTDHVIDAIDNCLEDWSVGPDAMRWNPDREEPPPLSPPVEVGERMMNRLLDEYTQWTIENCRCVLCRSDDGMTRLRVASSDGPRVVGLGEVRIVEAFEVPAGEVWVTRELQQPEDERFLFRTFSVPMETRTDVQVRPGIPCPERDELVQRLADAMAVPLCVIAGHKWPLWTYQRETMVYRRKCERPDCSAFEMQHARYGTPPC